MDKKYSIWLLTIVMLFPPFFCKAQEERVDRVRAYNKKKIPTPPGMVYIPGGTIVIKYNEQYGDSTGFKQVSLSPFFIDETEVTNREYREFVDDIADGKDSVNKNGNDRNNLQNDKVVNYAFTYFKRSHDGKDGKYVTETINIYPDTKVWATDFPNSQTDMMVKDYFTSRAYDDYPVVGVTWKQAQAYASWRSANTSHKKKKNRYYIDFDLPCTLPSEAQWVYAAEGEMRLGKIDSFRVPRDRKGRLLANFKQSEGDYNSDGSSYTMNVMSYAPNRFGLYNMYGNVAEWTLDAYNESAWAFVHDQNPVLLYDADSSDADVMKRKVVRGGSWKDNAHALSPYSRSFEVQDVPHSYIGFRCVMPAPEILTKKVASRNKEIR